jgi:excisionase family DNA binding protein
MVDAISPKGYLTVAQVADRLGVSVSRVNRLVSAGDLRSDHLGAITVIPEADVERRLSLRPGDGRRLTSPNAWGIIAMASGERAPWLSPDTRYRLRRLLDKHGLTALRARLVKRAVPHGFRAHPSVLGAIRDNNALMLTGVTAAAELRLGLLAGDTVDAYVAERALPGIVARHRLQESHDPNVVLRSVPSFVPSWPQRRIAPKAAVALDLLDDADPRSRQVGKELLGRLST